MSTFELPQELLSSICAYIYAFGLPSSTTSLDPLITCEGYGIPTSLPSSLPPSHWTEITTRHALSQLCLVNHAWYEAAKPWLWRKLEVRLPRSWLSLVDEIAWNEDPADVGRAVDSSIKAAAGTVAAQDLAVQLEECLLDKLHWPDGGIPPELLSPAASRDPSPRRLRQKSPARWEIMRSITDTIQTMVNLDEPGLYVPIPNDPRPGRFVRHFDFNHFRTIGMRRSVSEGVQSRFVTGDRVHSVLKEMPNLLCFGATEYMDGALTLPVLEELFLRGAPARGRGRPSRGRGLISHDPLNTEEEDRERRRNCRDLEAVDLTGCVSAVFVNALTEFVETHLLQSSHTSSPETTDDEGRRSRASREEPPTFPGLLRLGLRGVKSILPRILTPFVLSFPSLTHLDLSGSRANPELLRALGESRTVRLTSLALARCVQLTSESIRDFIVSSPVTSALTELNLYGDCAFPSPLTEHDLQDVLTLAPCFNSRSLVYLDLSSTPLTDRLLSLCPEQPCLRSLGLSHIPTRLSLKPAISSFILGKASGIEVLTLVNTSPELDCGMSPGGARGSPRAASVALHTHLIRPLCTPPFSFSLTSNKTTSPPPTRLRVIELSTPILAGLGGGAGAWRIIRSKGGRGWYVDTASGWVTQVRESERGDCQRKECTLRRDLDERHPYRMEMMKLSSANGNVSSGVGWHGRKMEILHGHGMLGREDGLYGAVSFAYQG